jgi:hypothetical protein
MLVNTTRGIVADHQATSRGIAQFASIASGQLQYNCERAPVRRASVRCSGDKEFSWFPRFEYHLQHISCEQWPIFVLQIFPGQSWRKDSSSTATQQPQHSAPSAIEGYRGACMPLWRHGWEIESRCHISIPRSKPHFPLGKLILHSLRKRLLMQPHSNKRSPDHV